MRAKIGLDPGHGGKHSGTYTVNSEKDGLFEKDYALELALLIEEKLVYNGFEVVMTRREDETPGGVDKRAEMLAAENCDFGLSIHFNGFKSESANGTEVFVPYAEDIGLIEAGFYRELGKFFRLRKPFARSNNYYNRDETFDKKLDLDTGKFLGVADKKDYFGFIRRAWSLGISADLLEVCFLTNKTDFDIYNTYKEEIAEGIAKSIIEAYGEEYKKKTPPKKPQKINCNTVNLIK